MSSKTNDIKSGRRPPGGQRSHLIPTLDGLRNKLLDLTTRNNLLNLSLNDKRTRRLIRFVHSDLQGTLSALCSGTTALPLLSLPDPPEDKLNEIDDDEFEAAMAAARCEDPLYQQILADSAGDKGLSPALASAEDRLRSQVREALEQSGKKRRATPNLAKWAESQGISPSYELPCRGSSRGKKSTGIQTLLLGARLERVAEAIRKQAISSIEETGNNILYLTFGGLSWNVKDKELFAPLVLLPVELINTGARGRERRYTLKAVDDVPLENVTLRERLKRDFSVDLPELGVQDKGIELDSYLDAVAAVVTDNENWSVRRFMNLSLFSFSGLGLYRDLEPEIIQKSRLVRQILAVEASSKKDRNDEVKIAEDETVDKPDISKKVPVLITQADASQFAAIADAMDGRSMVIEGPPGTGKSQTITNIIANALYAGKRVLFVAEKKVALDVVYTRLSEASLREYCLRIASDKVNKREVYSELGDRLRIDRPMTKDREPTCNVFNELRKELNDFCHILNRGFGSDRKSFQTLVWEELYLRQKLKRAKVDLSAARVEISGAGSLTRASRDRYCQIFEQLAALKTELPLNDVVAAFSPLGVNPTDVLGREKLIDYASRWDSTLVELAKTQDHDRGLSTVTLEEMRKACRELTSVLERLPEPLEIDLEWLLPHLASREIQERAEALVSAIDAERLSTEKLNTLFDHVSGELPSANDLFEFLTAWRQWRLGDTGMPVARAEREALAHQLAELDQVIERIEIVMRSSNCTELLANATPRHQEVLLACLKHLAELPAEVLRTRQTNLWTLVPREVDRLLELHCGLQRQLQELGIEADHPVLEFDSLALEESSGRLKQALGLGLGHVFKDDDGVRQWHIQHDNLEQCLSRVSTVLAATEAGCRLSSLPIHQLLDVPRVLQALKELTEEVLSQRSSTLWDSSTEEIEALRKASEEIRIKEEALKQASLTVHEGVAFYAIQSAAKKLKSTPWILQAFDGDYSKAVKLAKRIGAIGKASQQAKSLQEVASLVELVAKFPEKRLAELCRDVSSLEEASRIVSELEKFKAQLQSNQPALLGLARSLSPQEIAELYRVYEAGLDEDLRSLAEQTLLGSDSEEVSLSDLALRLKTNKEHLVLVEPLVPFVRWGVSAGVGEPELIAEWLEAVADYISAFRSFPSRDLMALCDNQCTQEQAITSLQALQSVRSQLATTQPLDGVDEFLRTIPIAEIDSSLVLLRDQLLTAVHGLSQLLSGHGVSVDAHPLGELIGAMKDVISSFQCLVRRHTELGFVSDLSVEAMVSAPIDLKLHQKRQTELANALSSFRRDAGDELNDASTQALGQAMGWIIDLRSRELPSAIERECLSTGSGDWIRKQSQLSKQLSVAIQEEDKAATDFLEIAQPILERLPGRPASIDACLTFDLQSWLNQITALGQHLSQWVRLNELVESLPSDAERQLAAWLMEQPLPDALWPALYRWNILKSRLSDLLQSQPQLQTLRSSDQVARRKRFTKAEDDLCSLDRSEVIAAIHRDPDDLPQGIDVGLKADFTEMGLIRNESVKRIKHRPLRHLFQFAGNALRGLKPCWMMSPATVASLLPRGKGEDFDLVVIDEASQMSPERALGVISRAKQCVVVGDPQQLPPTSLFQRSVAWDEGDDAEEVDLDVLEEESILDLASKAFQPTRRLKWHYRSRNGSLIAFSNQHFYNNQLVVFPASRREFAITRHLVDEPRYRRGVNEPEVRDVCDIVLHQLEVHPERTLGVVAMNEGQAEAIAEQLDDLAFHHEELRRRLDLRDNSESLFVKPLEKVQGDERDTIVISTTYGPSDPGGPVALRFGLLNRSSGHRRLNVLFTRAKHAIEMVTSIQSSQLRLPATAGPGLLAFRDYLRYVEKNIEDSELESPRDPKTPFEKVLFSLLTEHGFTADCGVGFANYFIDLAIRHPEASDHYLLALEGDGENYNSARAARDRDKYRQAVLEGLGWNVYKIWSTDWFENPDGELKKLVGQLKRLSKSTPIPVSRQSTLHAPVSSPARPRSPSLGAPQGGTSEESESDPDPEPAPLPQPAAPSGTSHGTPRHRSAPPLSAGQTSDVASINPAPPGDDPGCEPPASSGSSPSSSPSNPSAPAKQPKTPVVARDDALPAGVEPEAIRQGQDSPASEADPGKERPQRPEHCPDLDLPPSLPSDGPPGQYPVAGRRGLMPSVVPNPSSSLSQGCVVHCRSHRWLVEEVEPPELEGGDTVVRMACLDDDANGQRLEVFWEREVDAQVLGETTWDTVGQRGFDQPQVFGSYLNTLRWNCVTSTDPGLFQAPLRAGIDVKPYQLEPLRKALRMPRVSLFIADDVGLGKTIEAGLIMRELLLRQKVHRVVVVAPPSVVLQ
jgi:superfamily I DNA and/or RNA helicase